ncbi:Uncharacterized conserved protein, DUF983 family [Rhizobium sp. RU35A]|uniref:DUF983 domain-containing protein n=1 Tax=Rhizobium straminoryzae TaxID=1387186 RepID=A0A549TIS1_9HYPH|nr:MULTISPECIES: DUF983 domain-containing protein [Rhizobium]TRL43464.1 DUF983 domain-containing protein [Rhizobium straminoryzae]SIR16905.1 Uncharacterized conserved protein, DUF983 family [Rhizobium sp. RU35A]
MTVSSDHAHAPAHPIRYGGADRPERPLGQSILRGLKCTCPNCGSGRLFKSFLKPVDRCAACGEEMFHHRADDLPPYLVIFVIGHVTVGGFMMTDMVWHLSMWTHLAIWTPITILTALASMQPIKGGVIGLQWALRMHGFGNEDESIDPGRGGHGA